MTQAGRLKPQEVFGVSTAEDSPARSDGARLKSHGTTRIVRWLLNPVADISEPIQEALIGDIGINLSGILASAGNFLALNVLCCVLAPSPIFDGFLGVLIIATALRFASLWLLTRANNRIARRHTDFYVLTTLFWCVLASMMAGFALQCDATAAQVLGAVCVVGPQGTMAAKNASAPRFAMAIILALNLPFACGAVFSPHHWLIAVAFFTLAHLMAVSATIKRFQKLSIENYVAQFASKRQASLDPLTGILNRRGMNEAMKSGAETRVALFAMDLDGFKQVNDAHGHAAGDVLLQMVTARLHEVARKGDFLARLGGDEFALIAPGLPASAATMMAARLVAAISAPCYAIGEDVTVRIGVSVGFACAPEDAANFRELSERADAALYAVKQRGKGSWQRAQPA